MCRPSDCADFDTACVALPTCDLDTILAGCPSAVLCLGPRRLIMAGTAITIAVRLTADRARIAARRYRNRQAWPAMWSRGRTRQSAASMSSTARAGTSSSCRGGRTPSPRPATSPPAAPARTSRPRARRSVSRPGRHPPCLLRRRQRACHRAAWQGQDEPVARDLTAHGTGIGPAPVAISASTRHLFRRGHAPRLLRRGGQSSNRAVVVARWRTAPRRPHRTERRYLARPSGHPGKSCLRPRRHAARLLHLDRRRDRRAVVAGLTRITPVGCLPDTRAVHGHVV